MVATNNPAVVSLVGEARRLSDDDRAIIGGGVRIQIALEDSRVLRKVSDLMRGFCARLDHHSRRTDASERTILFEVKLESRALNRAIERAIFGEGKDRSSGAI